MIIFFPRFYSSLIPQMPQRSNVHIWSNTLISFFEDPPFHSSNLFSRDSLWRISSPIVSDKVIPLNSQPPVYAISFNGIKANLAAARRSHSAVSGARRRPMMRHKRTKSGPHFGGVGGGGVPGGI